MTSNPIEALRKAKTLRDIYNIPFPIRVASLSDLESFSAFQNSSWRFDIKKRNGQLEEVKNERYLTTAFDEARRIAYDYERAHQPELPDGWGMQGTGSRHEGRVDTPLHIDRYYAPKERVYVASVDAPTLIVSHADTLEAYKEAQLENVLDDTDMLTALGKFIVRMSGNLRDPRKTGKDQLNEEDLSYALLWERLRSRAVPCKPGAIELMSGVTFHQRNPAIREGRIFFRAYAYTSAMNHE